MNSARFVTLFQHFGRSWDQEEEDNKESQTFAFRLYGSSFEKTNNVWYKFYCRKFGKVALTELPPFENTLYHYNKRGVTVPSSKPRDPMPKPTGVDRRGREHLH